MSLDTPQGARVHVDETERVIVATSKYGLVPDSVSAHKCSELVSHSQTSGYTVRLALNVIKVQLT